MRSTGVMGKYCWTCKCTNKTRKISRFKTRRQIVELRIALSECVCVCVQETQVWSACFWATATRLMVVQKILCYDKILTILVLGTRVCNKLTMYPCFQESPHQLISSHNQTFNYYIKFAPLWHKLTQIIFKSTLFTYTSPNVLIYLLLLLVFARICLPPTHVDASDRRHKD